MKTQQITATALVRAPAADVYAIIADYRDRHPRILPAASFSFLHVEQGGFGAGTRIRFQMHAPGMTRTFLSDITEPEPGRVLKETTQVETGAARRSVTTFTVDPVAAGQQAQVTIATEVEVANALEGFFTSMFLRRTYALELKQLAEIAETRR